MSQLCLLLMPAGSQTEMLTLQFIEALRSVNHKLNLNPVTSPLLREKLTQETDLYCFRILASNFIEKPLKFSLCKHHLDPDVNLYYSSLSIMPAYPVSPNLAFSISYESE